MKIKLKFGEASCYTSVFRINDKDANYEDFGEKYDHSPDTAEEYGCGDMRFEKKEATPKILKKYNISQKEYDEICGKLEEGLSFGSCGWCV